MIKTLLTLIVLGGCLLGLTGCENWSSQMKERFSQPAPHTQTVDASQEAVYTGASIALRDMGLRITRGGPASGVLEAASAVSPGGLQDTRQITAKVRLSSAGETGTQVEVWFSEVLEERGEGMPAMATETPVRDPARYDAFFRSLRAALPAQPKA